MGLNISIARDADRDYFYQKKNFAQFVNNPVPDLNKARTYTQTPSWCDVGPTLRDNHYATESCEDNAPIVIKYR